VVIDPSVEIGDIALGDVLVTFSEFSGSLIDFVPSRLYKETLGIRSGAKR